MKIFELTNKKLIALILLSHISMAGIVVYGTLIQILSAVFISAFITLFASTVTYHRLLSHRSWNSPKWFEYFGSLLGVFSFSGSTISRTAIHRTHHKYVDKPGDPHSPKLHGRFFVYFPIKDNENISPRMVSDLLRSPLHRFIHKYYLAVILITFLILYLFFNFTWAVTLSIAPGSLCWLSICLLNMYGHNLEGSSVNRKILSVFTFGEGNHKFHHDNPNEANIGQGSFDPGYAVIKLLQRK